MILDISALKQNKTIDITGNENWLSQIYASFAGISGRDTSLPKSKGADLVANSALKQAPHLITGCVTFVVDNPSYVHITGNIKFEPLLDCSRCSKDIPWPIEETIDVFLLREKPQFDEETELTSSDLDEYYLEDNQNFNLEIAVNDVLQTAVPIQVVKRGDNGRCLYCNADLSNPIAITSPASESQDPQNPFAKLINVKLDE